MHNAVMGSMKSRSVRAALALVGTLAAGLTLAAGTDGVPLRLLYQERPPYTMHKSGGAVEGLLAEPVQQAAARAGIVVRWELTPSQRQLLLVQTGQEPVGGVGWFRNPEREKLGRFSRPLYRD